ncbi:calpain-9-like isoform X3 [Amphiura filiformis]|uniref:calpain-9-like isoform X3 n=1 Tax=Amphiura filiformis TaxID=82378 RepID=UPI003B2109A0
MAHFKQDFDEIKRKCLQNNELWEDPLFPAVDESIFHSQKPPRPFEWKRPTELVQDAQLFVGGASQFDVAQGELGDCWFLAASAGLSLDEHLLYKVVPPEQSFQRDYAGVFKFRFWQYGEWVDILVDDRLPTYYGRLVFVHSAEQNEFWSALLEKAYAKLHGSYEALKGGNTVEAMEDFTGGVSEEFGLKDNADKRLFGMLKKAYDRDSQLGCSINAKPGVTEAKLPTGLIAGHAYTITDLKRVTVKGQKVNLIKIRNPWGQVEWNGAWSDDSAEWNQLSASEKKDMGLDAKDDGEFWMAFHDFKRHYDRVDVCHLDPESMSKPGKKKWVANYTHGRWQKGATAGGCRNFPDTFWINPQIAVGLEEEDDDDDDDDDDVPPPTTKGCTFIVALMQKNRRKQMKMGIGNLTMGFAIYEYKGTGEGNMEKDFFLYNASKARSATFINTREISGRFRLPKGRFVIVPSTFEPNSEGDFLVRVYSLKQATSQEVDEETGVVDLPKQPVLPSHYRYSDDRFDLYPAPVDPNDPQTGKFREFFKKLTGDDMEVDAWELQEILNAAMQRDSNKVELKGSGFTLESCKSMVAMSDDDRSGKLGFEEFLELWRDIGTWKKVFKKYDKDGSGTFNAYELRSALRAVGYKLSQKTFGAMVLRYADKESQITFDNFIASAIKLKHMFTTFNENKSGNEAQFNLDKYLMIAMYS